MSKKLQYGTIGTVSHATMRPEDLIPAFIDELRYLGHTSHELRGIESRYAHSDDENSDYFESEESSWDLESLFDMLNEHALPWMYFGSHPGDGSDYGFWVSDGLEYDFDGLKVNDLSEVPNDYRGEILLVNDHGNMTLYNKTSKTTFKEVWAVV